MKNVQIGALILAAIAIGGALYSYFNQRAATDQTAAVALSEPIKVGLIGPLTGDAAQWGVPPLQGVQLAVEEINAHGGVLGRPLKLVSEDSQCDARVAVSAFNKLVSSSIKTVIGAVCSSETLSVAPIAENNKVLLVSPASTNPNITNAGDFIFRVVPSDSLRGKIFADYLFTDRGIKDVAFLYINNDSGVGNRDSFETRFKELGGRVVTEESYPQDANEMRSQITKIKKSGTSAVVVVSFPKDTVLVMQEAKELALGIPLYFQTEAVEDSSVLREAGDTAEGTVYILPAAAEGQVPAEFSASYENKFGQKPEIFAAEAYDIVYLIKDALVANKGNMNTSALRDYLYKVRNYPGASGEIMFDTNGDVLKPMAIKRIENGTPHTIVVK
jgi:branched-chain amino acid transport system substrate-binding protein